MGVNMVGESHCIQYTEMVHNKIRIMYDIPKLFYNMRNNIPHTN